MPMFQTRGRFMVTVRDMGYGRHYWALTWLDSPAECMITYGVRESQAEAFWAGWDRLETLSNALQGVKHGD